MKWLRNQWLAIAPKITPNKTSARLTVGGEFFHSKPREPEMTSDVDRAFDPTTAQAFSLNFLSKPIAYSDAPSEWIWEPAFGLEIKEATFCGKNKADDYKNT